VPKKFVVNGGLFANTFGQSVNFSIDEIIKSNDDGYLLIGSSNSGSLYIVKADSLGNESWHQSYNLQGGVTDAFQADDNGYIILGAALVKISQTGTIVWSKTVSDTSAFGSATTVTSIIKTPDNGFIVGAYLSNDQLNTFAPQNHIIKFNSAGMKQWDHQIDTTTGPFMVTMGADSFATIGLKPYDGLIESSSDTLIVSIFDYSGNEKISKRLYVTSMLRLFSVCVTNSGEISVAGSYMGSMICPLIEIDKDLNIISSIVDNIPYIGGIQPIADGGFIEIQYSMPYAYNISITKKDYNGSVLWTNTITSTINYPRLPYAIAESDGSVVVARTIGNSGSSNSSGVLLYKISKDGVSFEQ
jgi:hypothetical protein